MSVVIVKLMGGMGNQLFQYAAGRRLAERLACPIKLDATWYETDKHRRYALEPFNIRESFAAPEELESAKGLKKQGAAKLLFKARRRLGVFYPWTYLCEYEIGPVKPRVLQARGDVYLDGYWQSEKYFADAGDVIRREFALKAPPGPEVEALAARIRSVPAVSVHVRRGDLAAATKKFQVYGPPLKPEYYEHCLREMAERVPGAHFFVFSDDAEWPRANLKFPWPMTFVSPNARDFDDFRLMAMCRHHIIANSSFSWWAAWLAEGAGKIVFAPRHYVHENTLDTRDLIPDGWIIA